MVEKITGILEEAKQIARFRTIDFLEHLSDKQISATFYPDLLGQLKDYSKDSGRRIESLALNIQLLYYSIEIHNQILKNKENKMLLILAGDYLYSYAFEKIIASEFADEISKFTYYIKDYSQEMLKYIEGNSSWENLNRCIYMELAVICAKLFNCEAGVEEVSGKLGYLFGSYISESPDYEFLKDGLISEYENDKKFSGMIERVIYDIEGDKK